MGQCCCGCPEGKCACKTRTWQAGAPLLAHLPCGIALVLGAIGVGSSFAQYLHRFAPLFFFISMACVVFSLARWKKMNQINRLITVAVAVLVLVLWYPHRAHVFPMFFAGRDANMHMHHHH